MSDGWSGRWALRSRGHYVSTLRRIVPVAAGAAASALLLHWGWAIEFRLNPPGSWSETGLEPTGVTMDAVRFYGLILLLPAAVGAIVAYAVAARMGGARRAAAVAAPAVGAFPYTILLHGWHLDFYWFMFCVVYALAVPGVVGAVVMAALEFVARRWRGSAQ